MVQSADEKRGYQRGYLRAGSRAWDRVRRVVKIARGYRARLHDQDQSRTCAFCVRWTRGGDPARAAESACMWGTCRADFEWDLEPRMWAELPIGAPKNLMPVIVTQPDFGCMSWLPRNSSTLTEGKLA
jgi:hypothetical protein